MFFGIILWIDTRTNKYEGQIIDREGNKHYFNYSVCDFVPSRNQAVHFSADRCGVTKVIPLPTCKD
jgi:hypothetical protein